MGSSAICPNSGKTCGASWGCDGAHRFATAGTLVGKGDGRCARDWLLADMSRPYHRARHRTAAAARRAGQPLTCATAHRPVAAGAEETVLASLAHFPDLPVRSQRQPDHGMRGAQAGTSGQSMVWPAACHR